MPSDSPAAVGSGYRIARQDAGRACLSFRSGEGSVSRALRDLSEFLGRKGCAPAVVENATIVLAEVLNNVEEHAYRGRPGQPVHVALKVSAGRPRYVVEDLGGPLPLDLLPGESMPTPDPVAPETWAEGGYGWPMVRRLTQDLSYERRDGRNRLSFTVAGGSTP